MLKIKDRKYFPVRLLSRIYIFFDPGDGQGWTGGCLEAFDVPGDSRGARGEDTTHSRATTRLLTQGGKQEGEAKSVGRLLRAPGT